MFPCQFVSNFFHKGAVKPLNFTRRFHSMGNVTLMRCRYPLLIEVIDPGNIFAELLNTCKVCTCSDCKQFHDSQHELNVCIRHSTGRILSEVARIHLNSCKDFCKNLWILLYLCTSHFLLQDSTWVLATLLTLIFVRMNYRIPIKILPLHSHLVLTQYTKTKHECLQYFVPMQQKRRK